MIGEKSEIERLAREVNRLEEALVRKDRELDTLKRQNRFLGTLFDGIDEEIMVVDHRFHIHDVNRVFLNRYGLEKRAVIGKSCFEIKERSLSPCHLEGRPCPLIQARETGKRVELTHNLRDAGGETKELYTVMYPLGAQGEDIDFFVEIARDVTEQHKLERKLLQAERLAAVGGAVARVAHEFKNPLMVMGGFSNQIRKGLGDSNDLRKLDLILDEIGRLENLVSNLGDFTKEYRLLKRPADINALIRDVLNIMAGTYHPDIYFFREELSPDLGEINCDPDKLKQVFINIISNGIEAMSKGGRITVFTARTAEGIEVRIHDEGMGIPEEDLQHIFEPFYTTRKGGSGLGLSISYKIIEAHKGDITAVSSPGQGTTFVMRIPSG